MSKCNCDGTVDVSISETLFGDSVLNSLGIFESSFSAGATDPRPIACQEAVAQLKASGQDPCALDSPDDLQVLYQNGISAAWAVIEGTPASNSVQKAADIIAGTATPKTPVTGGGSKATSSSSYIYIIGAVLILLVGFILVFRST